MKFVMLCGLPGSGKSYYSEKLKKKNYIVHSSDEIRKELFGDEECQEDPVSVFDLLHSRIKTDLSNGKNVVYDAINGSSKRRINFLKEIESFNCEKKIIWLATPYEKCLNYNSIRTRHVPEDIIKRYYVEFEIPCYYEGWTNIQIISNFERKSFDNFELFKEMCNYDQKTAYHHLTLGEHISRTVSNVYQRPELKNYLVETVLAAKYHDIGKPFVASEIKSNGKIDGNMHYYNHENVSAQMAYFYIRSIFDDKIDDERMIYICGAIRLHMHPYSWLTSEKHYASNVIKYKRIWGDKLYEIVDCLHQADRLAK